MTSLLSSSNPVFPGLSQTLRPSPRVPHTFPTTSLAQPLLDHVVLRFGHTPSTDTPPIAERAQTLVSTVGEDLKAREIRFKQLLWKNLTQAPDHNAEAQAVALRQYYELLGDKTLQEQIRQVIEDPNFHTIEEPILVQAVRQLAHTFDVEANDPGPAYRQLKADIASTMIHLQQLYSNFTWSQEVPVIHHTQPDGEPKSVGEQFMDLVRQRNQLAQLANEPNFYRFRLKAEELDPDQVDPWMEQLKTTVLDMLPTMYDIYDDAELVAEVEEWKTLLSQHLKETDPETAIRKTATLMGINMDTILSKSDLYKDPSRPNKAGYTGYNLDINPPHDIRVLANISEDLEQRNHSIYGTLLHEFIGHAADNQWIDPSLPGILRDQHTFSTESLAVFAEQLIFTPEWLHKVLNIPKETLEQYQRAIAFQYLQNLHGAIQGYLQSHFLEKALYENPEQDMHQRNTQLFAEMFAFPAEQMRSPQDAWSHSLSLVTHPVNSYNYILGRAWAAKLMEILQQKGSEILTPETGAFLEKHRSQGLLHSWPEEIEAMTGGPLSIEPLLRKLASLVETVQEENPFSDQKVENAEER